MVFNVQMVHSLVAMALIAAWEISTICALCQGHFLEPIHGHRSVFFALLRLKDTLVNAGTGMSEAELQRNPVLTDFSVRDLNKEPKLPYEDNSFDVITNVVSVDYLNRPLVSMRF